MCGLSTPPVPCCSAAPSSTLPKCLPKVGGPSSLPRIMVPASVLIFTELCLGSGVSFHCHLVLGNPTPHPYCITDRRYFYNIVNSTISSHRSKGNGRRPEVHTPVPRSPCPLKCPSHWISLPARGSSLKCKHSPGLYHQPFSRSYLLP